MAFEQFPVGDQFAGHNFFSTVAAMVAASAGMADGEQNHTGGRITQGDGGEGSYTYNETGRPTANGGFAIDAASGNDTDYFSLNDQTVVNVLQWGVIRDGSDSSTALATVALQGGDILFPAGDYGTSVGITFGVAGQKIRGYGAKLTSLADIDWPAQITGAGSVLRGMEFDADGDNVTYSVGNGEAIRVFGTDITLRDVIARNSSIENNASNVMVVTGSDRILLTGCKSYNPGYACYRFDPTHGTMRDCDYIIDTLRTDGPTNARNRWLVSNKGPKHLLFAGGRMEFTPTFTSLDGGEGIVLDYQGGTEDVHVIFEKISIEGDNFTPHAASTVFKVEDAKSFTVRDIKSTIETFVFCRPSFSAVSLGATLNSVVIEGSEWVGSPISCVNNAGNIIESITLRNCVVKGRATDINLDVFGSTQTTHNLIVDGCVFLDGKWRQALAHAPTVKQKVVFRDTTIHYAANASALFFTNVDDDPDAITVDNFQIVHVGAELLRLSSGGEKNLIHTAGADGVMLYDVDQSRYWRDLTGPIGVADVPTGYQQIKADAAGDAFPTITNVKAGAQIRNHNAAVNGDAASWTFDGTIWNAD